LLHELNVIASESAIVIKKKLIFESGLTDKF
jgi:hypothetical protein